MSEIEWNAKSYILTKWQKIQWLPNIVHAKYNTLPLKVKYDKKMKKMMTIN